MRYRHIIAYAIHGLQASSLQEEIVLFNRESPKVRAVLLQNPDRYLYEIDRALALAGGMLRGFFGGASGPELVARVETEIEAIRSRRRKEQRSAAAMLIEVTGEVKTEVPEHQREFPDFTISFDAFDKIHVRTQDAPVVESLVTALALALGRVEPIQRLRDGTYLIDDSGKIHYSYSPRMGMASVSMASPFEKGIADRTKQIADGLLDDPELHSVVRLLLEAFGTEADPLRSFLSAWFALEIFINKVFASYEKNFQASLLADNPSKARSLQPNRLADVMKHGYGMSDKFYIISHFLAAGTAERDAEEFKALKKARDSLLHGQEVPEEALRSRALMDLVSRYLQAHLTARKDGSEA